MSDLKKEIAHFEGLWEGGYYEGDPLSTLSKSTYGVYGYISILHATYLSCIKPYINAETVALEIGPGRGAWTKTMLNAKEVWVLDALSAEYNRFYEYLDNPKNVKYIQVEDFSCRDLPENYFDYMFSFGCLCHVSFEGTTEYAKNLFDKLKSGADCFWLVADKKKYQSFQDNPKIYNIREQAAPLGKRYALLRFVQNLFPDTSEKHYKEYDPFEDQKHGKWFDAGKERTCEMLKGFGYEIVNEDVGTIPRDVIVHFRKP